MAAPLEHVRHIAIGIAVADLPRAVAHGAERCAAVAAGCQDEAWGLLGSAPPEPAPVTAGQHPLHAAVARSTAAAAARSTTVHYGGSRSADLAPAWGNVIDLLDPCGRDG